MDKSGIYTIEHLGSSNFYIGSSRRINARWYQHKKLLNRGKHHAPYLQNAWTKYGENAFRMRVLEECEVLDLLVREQFYLDLFKPSYNVCLFARSRQGTKQSPEAIEKVRQVHLGRKCSDETRAKIAAAHKGVPMPSMVGHVVSEETRAKLREKHLGKPKPTLRGRTRPPEVVEKVRLAQKGKPREWQRGVARDEETRAKISAAQKDKSRPYQAGENHWRRIHPELIPRGEQVGTAKLTMQKATEIRAQYAVGGVTLMKLANEYGVSKKAVLNLIHGRTWKEDS